MRPELIHYYNDEIKRIDEVLDDLKIDIEKYPEDVWSQINYVLLECFQGFLKKEMNELGENLYYEEGKND